MSDNNIAEAIANRVRALLAKTVDNGCTEAEALAAAAKARDLMDRYRLTQSDVDIQAEPIEDMLFEARNEQKLAAVDFCLRGIDRYCGVKSWYSWRNGRRHVRMLGLKGDAEMARYLYEMLATTIDSESASFTRLHRYECYDAASTRRLKQSFQIGMASRVNDRLIEMAKEHDAVAVTSTGTALVVVKDALVQDAYDRLGLKLRNGSKGPRARSHNAYNSGRAAGDRVNLSRPVNGQGQGRIA